MKMHYDRFYYDMKTLNQDAFMEWRLWRLGIIITSADAKDKIQCYWIIVVVVASADVKGKMKTDFIKHYQLYCISRHRRLKNYWSEDSKNYWCFTVQKARETLNQCCQATQNYCCCPELLLLLFTTVHICSFPFLFAYKKACKLYWEGRSF